MKKFIPITLGVFVFVVGFSSVAGSSKTHLCGMVKGEEFQFLGPKVGTDLGEQYIHKMNFSKDVDYDTVENSCPIVEEDKVVVTGLFQELDWFSYRYFVYLIPVKCLSAAFENKVSYFLNWNAMRGPTG